ncbi:rod shape-determining protein MreC [Malaciobacter marinus]|uniref:Rod shape-determining protein MreC n=1 Tax=Malaciobacter marinus TaxID=505249 RepID=A0A347TP86_9BACT|nr:rod shape-determining protein MreC [Malaciobacter marinus]AXX88414.1 rod shape-determining protein MreC [Malaciobacter marinus]PHO16679.1 rod shape-determining protein MreC [Malaciobacter marinus]RYA24667.1 rod shape-determining protein MreC [Malaciobacter halophilus]
MNKLIFFILFLAISLLYILDVNKLLGEKFTLFNNIKEFYIHKVVKITNFTEKYFYQASTIEELKQENEKLKEFRLLYESKNQKLTDLVNSIKKLKPIDEKLIQTRVLSYVEFDDFTKVWLDKEKLNDQISGLVIDDYAAGIVVKKNDKALALLNGNEKSNYAVYIGKNKAPGITHSIKKSKYIVAKYIPIWIDINVGDEVTTSGMDNIFFKGLKVGKVVSINKMPDMQEAVIEPYAKVLKRRFFYIYTSKLLQKEQKNENETINLKKEQKKIKKQ